ncbi:hypothetical protein KO481_09110 [Nocardia sp. NEAU-G5]|uniref:Uncharacterized protein n=1 Tax=Nocardia albiluteola TaxID=2842303 RepID=A0ABS6AUI3_9NOCA|nr:hypothetical protein [Nocardia albiluteola]MBU3061683.1 hypothetical protein [Nocardia albiluteola]
MTTVTTTMRRFPRIARQLLNALVAAAITVVLSYLLLHTWSGPAPATPPHTAVTRTTEPVTSTTPAATPASGAYHYSTR